MIHVTKVTVDTTEIINKLNSLTQDEDTMTLIHANYAKILDPYVPYDTGYLSQDSVEIESDGVVYTADYAWRQYYGEDFKHKTEVHPLATARWDEVAMQTQSDVVQAMVRDVLVEKFNNG